MKDLLARLGLEDVNSGAWGADGPIATHGERLEVTSPLDGTVVASVRLATRAEYEQVLAQVHERFRSWREVPAPKRGEVVRAMGEALRAHKEDLGRLITLEVGKVLSEGEGEVQESVDMADFAVGLSRQLYGLSLHSERPQHRMYEQWHPLGVVGVITAFNFPNAVWAWNAMVAAVCGDTVLWKPSLKAPLTAIATHRICAKVFEEHGFAGVFGLVIGSDAEVGQALVHDRRVPLISATGSVRMGRLVGEQVARRLGRSLLELGGNNAILVHKDADLDLALRAVAFAAVGTSGQRCTTARRLLVHREVADVFLERLTKVFGTMSIGNPLEDPAVLMGPLIDEGAVQAYHHAIATALEQGARLRCGGQRLDRSGYYVQPTLLEVDRELPICREETFAPILYAFRYDDLEEAIALQNGVDQGLSSALFTDSFRAAETFLSAAGSDCGIANINIGTSGAEIGGAFGGEKDTGGGREAGSDCWKAYMRRQTCTLNWGRSLPLAQGVRFDVD